MRQFKSAKKNVGKISCVSLGFLTNCKHWSMPIYTFISNLKRLPTAKQLEWLHLIIEEKGTIIPDNRTLLRLAYHGFIKIEATEEGKAFFEKEGRSRILVKYLEKL